MTLQQFLNSKNYDSEINQILLNIEYGSIKMYQKLNEETDNVLGSSGKKNIQDEEVQKLDLIANKIFIDIFKGNGDIAKVLSEENEDIIELNNTGEYLIAMDPLDGS